MRSGRLIAVTAWTGWLLAPAALVVVLLTDREVTRVGRPDLTQLHADTLIFVPAMISSVTVGAALVLHRRRHPVGWLFLALGDVLALGAMGTSYAAYGALARPGSLPAAAVVGVLADVSFVWWLVLVALVLYLTPTGRAVSRRWAYGATATLACGAVWFTVGLLRPGQLNPPLQGLANPMGWELIGGAFALPTRVVGWVTGIGVVLGGASLVVRWRRSAGTERQRLWWMILAAILVPALVAGTFVSSYTGNGVAVGVAAGGFVVVLPVAGSARGDCVGRGYHAVQQVVLHRATRREQFGDQQFVDGITGSVCVADQRQR
jgi:hypothetical protein